MLHPLLDNIVWHCLAGPHAAFSAGTSTSRRYASGFSPIIGFANAAHPDLSALVPYCEPGEHFYCGGWSGVAPSGWQIHDETSMHQLVWDAPVPVADDAFEALPLGAEHVAQMLALVALTFPGPFAARTRELGEYFGVFHNGLLVAMAGERMQAGTLREVSGVCTHPEAQGRGYARGLMLKVIRRQMRRGQTPFLHVMRDNARARQIYERMGFRHHQDMIVRVVSRER